MILGSLPAQLTGRLAVGVIAACTFGSVASAQTASSVS
jgi:hypothetical protein